MAWGYHLIIDASACKSSAIRCSRTIADFSRVLVKRIDMIPYGQPEIVHFGTDGKMGYTLVQLIETSNICAHFCEETNDMYLDVFSCKSFCTHSVKDIVQHYFAPYRMHARLLTRQAPLA